MSENEGTQLWELGLRTIRELEDDRGILASGREEVYGCIFGRDSLLTSLSLLRVHKNDYQSDSSRDFLPLVRRVLENLAALQGTEINIESGEEPGKCIHEFRPNDHERLTKHAASPWYVYPDDAMRNYDSVDSTPLFLMTVHAYWKKSGDDDFVETLMPNIRAALMWITMYGDSDGDGFIDYRFHPDRSHGGLMVQSWMDSGESIFYEDNDTRPPYPIAPVEVQAYAYVALRAWSDFFTDRDADLAELLDARASALKKRFNDSFVLLHNGSISLAYALDGGGRALKSPRSSMGHCLWAVYQRDADSAPESILESRFIEGIARRLLARDMFVPSAGIRTLSSRSRRFDAMSYHNGSIWPHDTAMTAEGLENFGYHEEAKRVRSAIVKAYSHFNTPIELFAYSRGFKEYRGLNGGGACRKQAWSAASLLSTVEILLREVRQ